MRWDKSLTSITKDSSIARATDNSKFDRPKMRCHGGKVARASSLLLESARTRWFRLRRFLSLSAKPLAQH